MKKFGIVATLLTSLLGTNTCLASSSGEDYDFINPQQDLEFLAEAIYYEARGEPLKGRVAVCEVIINRTDARGWEDTIKGVVTQYKQFSYRNSITHDRVLAMVDYESRRDAYRVASKVLSGNYNSVVGKHAYHYYNPHKANPAWKNAFPIIGMVGNHKYLGK